MATKLRILLLLTAVAQCGLAQNTSSCCLPLTQIGSDLAALKLGEDMARNGYRYVTQVLFDEQLAILAERAAGHHYNPNSEYAKLRAGLAENRTWTGFLLGTNPTLDAMRLVNSSLDVATLSQIIAIAFRPVSANLLLAMKIAQGHNCTALKAEIRNISATVVTDLANAVGLFIVAETPNPPITLSTVDENVVECIKSEALTNVDAALARIFDGIYLLADALCDPNLKNNVEKYVSQLLALRGKVAENLDGEVQEKFTVIRNLWKLNYLKNATGTLATLLAFEAPYADYMNVSN